MYLLILIFPTHQVLKVVFTFHNVSINSDCTTEMMLMQEDLHSIMYLLIPNSSNAFFAFDVFTFHNVSINSGLEFYFTNSVQHLHSIMYLLIRFQKNVIFLVLFYLHSIMYLLILMPLNNPLTTLP